MGNNHKSIKFLRATRDAIVRNSVEQLSPGQPLYNIDDNYLTVGDKSDSSVISKLPITVREVNGWFEDNDGIQSNKLTNYYIKPTDNKEIEIKSPDIVFNRGTDQVIKLSDIISKRVKWHEVEDRPPIDSINVGNEELDFNNYKTNGEYIITSASTFIHGPSFSGSFYGDARCWLEVEKRMGGGEIYQYLTMANWVGYRFYQPMSPLADETGWVPWTEINLLDIEDLKTDKLDKKNLSSATQVVYGAWKNANSDGTLPAETTQGTIACTSNATAQTIPQRNSYGNFAVGDRTDAMSGSGFGTQVANYNYVDKKVSDLQNKLSPTFTTTETVTRTDHLGTAYSYGKAPSVTIPANQVYLFRYRIEVTSPANAAQQEFQWTWSTKAASVGANIYVGQPDGGFIINPGTTQRYVGMQMVANYSSTSSSPAALLPRLQTYGNSLTTKISYDYKKIDF